MSSVGPLGPPGKPQQPTPQEQTGAQTDSSGMSFSDHMNTPSSVKPTSQQLSQMETSSNESQLVSNYQNGKAAGMTDQEAANSAFKSWFPSLHLNKQEFGEFMKNMVHFLSTQMKREQAQMKKASENLKKSIEG